MESLPAPLPSAMGTVRWFDQEMGHGFIAFDRGGADCFLHQSGIRDEDRCLFAPGTRVSFDVVEGVGGPYAVNTRLL